MTRSGKGHQLGGALDGQLVTWRWLQGDLLQVETTLNGTEVVKSCEGQVCNDGKRISVRFERRDVIYEWMSKEEEASLRATLEPDNAPVCNYPKRPPGKIVFISGLPGSGKSSTGRILAAQHGFVYYEVDCFWTGKNPFLPPDGTGPIYEAIDKQRWLHGKTLGDRFGLFAQCRGGPGCVPIEQFEDSLVSMCKDVLRLRAQVGGDWVVTFGLPTRRARDIVASQLEASIVVLEVDEETTRERLMKRENGNTRRVEGMLTCRDEFERVEDSEKVIKLTVSSRIKKSDVAEEIIRVTTK